MEFDVEDLLAPISEDEPAGPDLSYDTDRYNIEQPFEASVSVDSSGEASAEAETDWRDVIRDVVRQFGRTKDVWLAVYLCRAGAKAGELAAVEAGAQALEGLFSRYWETVHPTLDELGVPGRKTPCDSLARRAEFLGPLERTPLIRHPRLGAFSGADLERFRSQGTEADGYGFFRAALEELGDSAVAEAYDQLDRIETAFRAADRAFMDAAPGEDSPNFTATYETLATLKRAAKSFLTDAPQMADKEVSETRSETKDADLDVGGGRAGAGDAAAGGRLGGRIDSREDVLRAIDLICDYYRRREPASPVPLVLQRAQSWVNADFMDILNDILPDSLDSARAILMRRPAEEEAAGEEY